MQISRLWHNTQRIEVVLLEFLRFPGTAGKERRISLKTSVGELLSDTQVDMARLDTALKKEKNVSY